MAQIDFPDRSHNHFTYDADGKGRVRPTAKATRSSSTRGEGRGCSRTLLAFGVVWCADYTLVIMGNEVVVVDPLGEIYPFYQRSPYRANRVRWVKRRRFVSPEPLHGC